MRRQTFRRILVFLRDNAVQLLLFAVVVVLFFSGVQEAKAGSEKEEMRMVEQSIRRAIVSCYAINGFYPDSFHYILENFDIRYNDDKYVVHYSVFAENIMPDVRIIEVGS